ncbi:MAG: hypothetical protein HQK89_03180 [Nitrospirae bacterium]|nr:hypothetical protein [Nitrospirota bacterium]
MDESKKEITRREAMKRIALKGLAMGSLMVGTKVFAAQEAEEIIRYNSHAEAGEQEKPTTYADYTSYSSSHTYSSTFDKGNYADQYSSAFRPYGSYYYSANYGSAMYGSYGSHSYFSQYSSMYDRQYWKYSSFNYSRYYFHGDIYP